MYSDICRLYNLNIINLNQLIKNKIILEINNFLYDNSLLELSENSKDRKKIYNHFIINNILNVVNENYNNIFLYDKNVDDSTLQKYILKIADLLKLNIFPLSEISDNLDINLIYQFKSLAENKKKIDIKKIQDFCHKNNLTFLSDKIKNNIKTKLLLHK